MVLVVRTERENNPAKSDGDDTEYLLLHTDLCLHRADGCSLA